MRIGLIAVLILLVVGLFSFYSYNDEKDNGALYNIFSPFKFLTELFSSGLYAEVGEYGECEIDEDCSSGICENSICVDNPDLIETPDLEPEERTKTPLTDDCVETSVSSCNCEFGSSSLLEAIKNIFIEKLGWLFGIKAPSSEEIEKTECYENVEEDCGEYTQNYKRRCDKPIVEEEKEDCFTKPSVCGVCGKCIEESKVDKSVIYIAYSSKEELSSLSILADAPIIRWIFGEKEINGMEEFKKEMNKESKMTLVYFWGHWSKSSKEMKSEIKKLAEEKNVNLININMDASKYKENLEISNLYKISKPIGKDETGKNIYGLEVPQVMLVDGTDPFEKLGEPIKLGMGNKANAEMIGRAEKLIDDGEKLIAQKSQEISEQKIDTGGWRASSDESDSELPEIIKELLELWKKLEDILNSVPDEESAEGTKLIDANGNPIDDNPNEKLVPVIKPPVTETSEEPEIMPEPPADTELLPAPHETPTESIPSEAPQPLLKKEKGVCVPVPNEQFCPPPANGICIDGKCKSKEEAYKVDEYETLTGRTFSHNTGTNEFSIEKEFWNDCKKLPFGLNEKDFYNKIITAGFETKITALIEDDGLITHYYPMVPDDIIKEFGNSMDRYIQRKNLALQYDSLLSFSINDKISLERMLRQHLHSGVVGSFGKIFKENMEVFRKGSEIYIRTDKQGNPEFEIRPVTISGQKIKKPIVKITEPRERDLFNRLFRAILLDNSKGELPLDKLYKKYQQRTCD